MEDKRIEAIKEISKVVAKYDMFAAIALSDQAGATAFITNPSWSIFSDKAIEYRFRIDETDEVYKKVSTTLNSLAGLEFQTTRMRDRLHETINQYSKSLSVAEEA